jgi:NAD(P)-dependent dehydrogenase (short-subunit alcohol dehydrogenase family)
MAKEQRPRTALVTGGGGVLGGVMAEALLDDGYCVVAMDVDAAALGRFRDRNAAHPGRTATVLGDVSSEADCRRAVRESVQRFGGLEILINNAGVGVSSLRPDAEANLPTLEELTPEVWQRFFAVNVHGAFYIAREAIPHMKAAGWGRIVNNTTSFVTMLRVLPYGAAKAALECMAAVWAEELKPAGITVNVLVPGGPTDTPFVGSGSGWARSRMIHPSVMAAPCAWLCSAAADGVTGRRFIAARWEPGLDAAKAAAKAGAPIGWPELAEATRVWPTR